MLDIFMRMCEMSFVTKIIVYVQGRRQKIFQGEDNGKKIEN